MQRLASWRLGVLACVAMNWMGCTVETTGSRTDQLIKIDGSSTVAPISMAIAEVFDDNHPDVTLKVNVSGTGGGFESFALGNTDISNASRPIKASEAEDCEKHGVKYVELMVATDGLTVAVHPQNDWCNALTIEQLAELWKKDSPVSQWSDLDPSWPSEPIKLFGSDAKSGTYDYFKEETVGKDNPMRVDYQPNTDDNVLVTGVAGDRYALGFFGFAYFVENSERLKAVAIVPRGEPADAAVLPSQETIENGTYRPLSRPLLIYVNLASLKRPEVREFAEFHLSDEGQQLVTLKGYIKLNPQQLEASRAKLAETLKSLSEDD